MCFHRPMSTSPLPRQDFEAALATRKELGPTYENELVDSFVDKVEAALVARGQQPQLPAVPQAGGVPAGGRIAAAIVSVVMAIPLTAITLGEHSLLAMIIVWVGLISINAALAGGGRSGSGH